MNIFGKPSAYTSILNRLAIVDADPSLGEGIWSADEERVNEMFKFFKLGGRPVQADVIKGAFDKAKADHTFGKGGLTWLEEFANELTKLWNAAKLAPRAEAVLSLKTSDIKARNLAAASKI